MFTKSGAEVGLKTDIGDSSCALDAICPVENAAVESEPRVRELAEGHRTGKNPFSPRTDVFDEAAPLMLNNCSEQRWYSLMLTAVGNVGSVLSTLMIRPIYVVR